MKNYVITIARGFGSGGKDIGLRLEKELGIPCYERQILTMASDFSGIDESIFVETDEKLRGAKIANRLGTIPTTAILEPKEKKFISDENVFNIQAEIIRSLAKSKSCIIVGKCADDVLKDYDNVISVYIEAPRATCVKNICDRMHVSKERANKLISSTDKYRAKYYSYYTGGKDWTNPTNYDLVLNTGRVKRDECVKIIQDFVKIKLITNNADGGI